MALFEAVRKQQATIESKVAGARTTSKAEMAVASSVDKGKFFDMLKAKKVNNLLFKFLSDIGIYV